MALMIGALSTVFVVENYQHWTDDWNIYYVSHFAPVLVRRSLPTKKELGYKHLNSAEFISSFSLFLFWILKQTAEAYASGTSQAVI